MHNGIVKKLRFVRYIPKMMKTIISLRGSGDEGLNHEDSKRRSLKVAKGCLLQLRSVMDNNGHVLLNFFMVTTMMD